MRTPSKMPYNALTPLNTREASENRFNRALHPLQWRSEVGANVTFDPNFGGGVR